MKPTSERKSAPFFQNRCNTTQFPVKILHAMGGGAKALSVPNTSASFTWTAKEVASSGVRGTIYIWAQADMALHTNGNDTENECLWM